MQENEKEARTTRLGLYHYALSYWKSAEYLSGAQTKQLKITHPDAPVYFLYYHAIELFLKSFLRHKGLSVRKLENISHRIKELYDTSEKHGLFFMDEDVEVILLMSKADTIIRSRYIATGYFNWPTKEALSRTCASLHETIHKILKDAGELVRY